MRILSGAVASGVAAGALRKWLPNAIAAVTLAAIAVGSGFAWRIELESQGWEGTRWVYRTHLAFPIAMAVFAAWSIAVAAFVHRVRGWRIALLVALFAVIAVAAYFAIRGVLLFAFGGWGGGLLSMELAAGPQHVADIPRFLTLPQANEVLFRDLVFWCVWLVPTLAMWGALRAAGVRSPIWSVPVSAAVQFWAWPVSIWLLAISDARGGSDPAHALKSGLVIPFLVLAVGIPLVVTPPRAS